tara:strand:+ start:1761 stop:1865 length:105 start_codon:yes stop_codon:yes gene_type:complete
MPPQLQDDGGSGGTTKLDQANYEEDDDAHERVIA